MYDKCKIQAILISTTMSLNDTHPQFNMVLMMNDNSPALALAEHHFISELIPHIQIGHYVLTSLLSYPGQANYLANTIARAICWL